MAVQFRDYYETLGVSKTASDDEIQERLSQARAQISSRHGQGEGKSRGRGKIQTDQRGLRGPERSGEAQEIRSARRGLESAGRISTAAGLGAGSNLAADFIVTPAAMAALSSNLAGPGSAISSKRSSAAVAASRRSAADLAGDRRRRSADRMSRPTSWSRWRKRCMAPSGRLAAPRRLRESGNLSGQNSARRARRTTHSAGGPGRSGRARREERRPFSCACGLARHPDFSVEGNDLDPRSKLEPWQAVLGRGDRGADVGRRSCV